MSSSPSVISPAVLAIVCALLVCVNAASIGLVAQGDVALLSRQRALGAASDPVQVNPGGGLSNMLNALHVPQARPRQGAPAANANDVTMYWLNHLALAPGASARSEVSTVSGVYLSKATLHITSNTTGDTTRKGNVKWLSVPAPSVPTTSVIIGVRVCYHINQTSLSNGTAITQVRLAQAVKGGEQMTVRLDMKVNYNSTSKHCVDTDTSSDPTWYGVLPSWGALQIDLRIRFGSVYDEVVLYGAALHLTTAPSHKRLFGSELSGGR